LGNLGKNWIIYKNLGKFGLLEKNQRKLDYLLDYWIILKTCEKLHYLYKNLGKMDYFVYFLTSIEFLGYVVESKNGLLLGKNWITIEKSGKNWIT
jgi:hypothetical protein